MDILRYAAFTADPAGGNPAGVVVADELPEDEVMQQVAADVGYSETAFLEPTGDRTYRVRYFAPAMEVDFCGHATIASGVVLGEQRGAGRYELVTNAGPVPVDVELVDGAWTATLTSVEPEWRHADSDLLRDIVAAFGWRESDLDPAITPALAYAGAWHLVIALGERSTLAAMSYPFDVVRELMEREGLTTIQLVWREDATTFHARDPFPVGGVVEDPATGAAAAALGGYLRARGLVAAPVELTVHQGVDMGRPSLLHVAVPATGGIGVRGTAVPIPTEP